MKANTKGLSESHTKKKSRSLNWKCDTVFFYVNTKKRSWFDICLWLLHKIKWNQHNQFSFCWWVNIRRCVNLGLDFDHFCCCCCSFSFRAFIATQYSNAEWAKNENKMLYEKFLSLFSTSTNYYEFTIKRCKGAGKKNILQNLYGKHFFYLFRFIWIELFPFSIQFLSLFLFFVIPIQHSYFAEGFFTCKIYPSSCFFCSHSQ